jgi:hypothetical protein
MTLADLVRSGHLLWGVLLTIALLLLLSSGTRYQRSRARADLPRVLTDLMTTGLAVGAVLHLGFGIPHPTPLLVLYGLVLAGLLVWRWRIVNQLYVEQEAAMAARAAANRASRTEPD